jgi:3-methyladenine DNA glycosylase AlkD
MHPYTRSLINSLGRSADPEKAVGMKAYMKGQFDFFGITTPARRGLLRKHQLDHKMEDIPQLNTIVMELWGQPERELQYCGLEILGSHAKLWEKETIELLEHCIINKSWWDTVDPLSYDCAGTYFKLFPGRIKKVTEKWNCSKNIWLQRSSLLFQKSYKKNTDTELLSRYIQNLQSSKEFFVQKAIGWILREFAKTDATWVKTFVISNKLAALSEREAIKHL